MEVRNALSLLLFKYVHRNISEFVGRGETALSWQFIQQHFPWHVIFIVGGGLAISEGANASGLSVWLGDQFNGLENLSPYIILLLIVVIISLLTEMMSNAAAISLLTPILIALVNICIFIMQKRKYSNPF